ncbi:uncharacterized protein F4822DRAFT_424233 [Hypoxylon trugodes]|uniref:uncharacterized protein n=1 Tax=Hypoxylon trugodes TaxID=326681 RepID=UPI00219C5C18|nr:uncharacterized protein F4822DRAFT_424233 [Hypoxylon trugodes]KAI1393770.1 hypothetical protein F4822DRAFT_424233 [Hypoxylon trugodes]
MKFQLSALLLGVATTAVSAQNSNQTGPFYLHIVGGEGSSIDGYAGSCHAGAAIEGVCYGAGGLPDGTDNHSYIYYFNDTLTEVDGAPVGELIWKLPYTDSDGNSATVDQILGLQYSVNSNVAAPMFGFSYPYANIGFDADGKLFAYNYVDDSTFTPGTNPAPSGQGKAYYQWYVCWQYFTGYYYQSIAWVVSDPPHNPTCEAVTIIQVFPSS